MNKLIALVFLVIVSTISCLHRFVKDDESTTGIETTETTKIPCLFDCSDEPDGDYPDPTSNCTAHYFVCANGACFNYICPGELVYNAGQDDCIYKSDDPGCGTVVTSTGGTTETWPTRGPCLFDCSDEDDGDYPDPTNNCTSHYFVCANGECFNYNCHTPLVFNYINDTCVYQKDWPGCDH